MLGIVTAIILLTSWRVFHGHPEFVSFASVGDVARQLEPVFGSWAKIVFCIGILAGGLSSFLINAMIGGTVMSDAMGKGSRLTDRWPLHMTTIALLIGMTIAMISLAHEGSTVKLIILAQALTVLGIPALALALIYLGTRRDLTGERQVPRPILLLAIIGFCVACVLACMTAHKVYQKLQLSGESTAAALGVGKPELAKLQLLPQDAIFLFEVLDYVLLLPVDPEVYQNPSAQLFRCSSAAAKGNPAGPGPGWELELADPSPGCGMEGGSG